MSPAGGLPFELHGTLPALHQPVLLVQLTGWIDASGAANAPPTTTWAVPSLRRVEANFAILPCADASPRESMEESANISTIARPARIAPTLMLLFSRD